MRLGYNIGKIFAKLPLRRTICTSNLLKPTTRSMLVKHCGLAPSAPCCTALACQACFASLVPRRVQVAPAPPRHAAVLLYAPARLIRSQATARAGPIHITFCARRLAPLAESTSRCGLAPRVSSCSPNRPAVVAALCRAFARAAEPPPPWIAFTSHDSVASRHHGPPSLLLLAALVKLLVSYVVRPSSKLSPFRNPQSLLRRFWEREIADPETYTT